MKLTWYVVRRIAQLIPIIFFVIILNFTLIHTAPGDPAMILTGESATLEEYNVIRERYGLDKPLMEQFIIYLTGILGGDLGHSIIYNRPIISMLAERLLPTLLLTLPAIGFAILFGTLLGTYAAKVYPSRKDSLLSFVLLVIYSTPRFCFGLLLILVFAVAIPLFPTSGMRSVGKSGLDYVLDVLYHLFLPVIALGSYYLTLFQRLARASVIEVMKEHYITVTRAQGFSENRIFYKYALKNAFLPTLSMASIYVGLAVSGSILIETVFSWPGIGRLIMESILFRDYPTLMGILVVVSLSVMVISLISDVILCIIDPRVRLGEKES